MSSPLIIKYLRQLTRMSNPSDKFSKLNINAMSFVPGQNFNAPAFVPGGQATTGTFRLNR